MISLRRRLLSKRFFDFSVASIALILMTPLFISISLIVFLCDNGPVFFKQERIGRNGGKFIIYKFRTMRVLISTERGVFEPGKNSRVTLVGKFLRKTKLDELPQLFNVIKGDMSIVGPRPEVSKWINEYPERWERILSIKPGITDNASIVFRNEESMLAESNDPEKTYKEIILPKKLTLYEDYVANNTFSGDLKLIFMTLNSLISK